jgi:hypothetical protein
MDEKMSPQPGPMIAPRPPLAAYREDLARRGGVEPFGPSDATWLSVATILSHSVDLPADGGPPLIETLRKVIEGDLALRAVIDAADQPVSTELELDAVSPIIRAIGRRMEDDGALHLAYSTLSTLADADVRLSILERGRVVAQLGRVAWKVGALETSREHYRRAEVFGRTARIPELRIRAWIGYSIVARLHGNYPEVRTWATRAAHEAERAGLGALGALAYHSLMVSAAVSGDLNAALVYGWRVFEGAAGDPAKEATALLNLAQYLLECGEPQAAVRGFIAALDRGPIARDALPALGGLALAAAAVGDRELVLTTKSRLEQMVARTPTPYECASALFELSQALATIGHSGAADCRARALEIAQRHAFHELSHRLESVRTTTPARRAEPLAALDSDAAAVAHAVASLTLSGAGARTDGR